MYNDYVDTPLGLMEIKATDRGLVQIIFCGDSRTQISANKITENCKQQLIQYFAGSLKHFDLPLDCKGTDFQKAVWQLLSHIPYGQTQSYQDIANQLGNPKAVRAVGGANGRNPLTIVVPCHRVIGANGSLTGYAGGAERKQWLLQHEGVQLQNQLDLISAAPIKNSRQDKTQYLL